MLDSSVTNSIFGPRKEILVIVGILLCSCSHQEEVAYSAYATESVCVVMDNPKSFDGKAISISGKMVPDAPFLFDDHCRTDPLLLNFGLPDPVPGREEFYDLLKSIQFKWGRAVAVTLHGRFKWPDDKPSERGLIVEEFVDPKLTTAPKFFD